MFHAMWELHNLRIPVCVRNLGILRLRSAVVGGGWPDYYTELVDHYSSSSDQLAIARIYEGGSNCKLYSQSFRLAVGYNFQQYGLTMILGSLA